VILLWTVERHDLFLAVTYDGAGGKFGKRVPRTAGVYVPHDSIDLAEFWHPDTVIDRNKQGASDAREQGRAGTASDARAADSRGADPASRDADPASRDADPAARDTATDSAV